MKNGIQVPSNEGILQVLPEVIAMSDRILVMREGRQMGIVESNNFTQETIMSLAMGEIIGDS